MDSFYERSIPRTEELGQEEKRLDREPTAVPTDFTRRLVQDPEEVLWGSTHLPPEQAERLC